MHGPTVEAHVEYHRSIGRDIPDHWLAPEIPAGYEPWYADYMELATDRQVDGGPIPAASIARHVTGWPADEAEAFRLIVRALDAALSQAVKDCDEMAGLPPEPKG